MEYVYAALLLHKAGKPIDESSISKILQTVGIEVDPSKAKSLVAAISEINIDEAIKSTQTIMPAASPATSTDSLKSVSEEKPEEEEKKEEEKEEEALEGLGALFG
jgi:large subunit ribosomal protein L12